MSRKSTILALCFSFAIPATMAFAKGEPQPNHTSTFFKGGQPEPRDDRNAPRTGDDNHRNKHGKTGLMAKGGQPEPGDDRNAPRIGDDNHRNKHGKTGLMAKGGQPEPGDDRGRGGKHPEPGDDRGRRG